MTRLPHTLVYRLAIAITCAFALTGSRARGEGEAYWELAPCRIEACVALDVAGGLNEQLSEALPDFLRDRAETAYGPTWDLRVQMASGPMRAQILSSLASFSEKPAAHFPATGDKLLLISVRQLADGFTLVGREYDQYVGTWGMPIVRHCDQPRAIAEQVFALACQVIAPVVRFEVAADDPLRVTLVPRGSGFPQQKSGVTWTKPGDLYVPALRRTTRGGQLIAGGVQIVPWTYIQVDKVDGDTIVGRVFSGSRRPFGARRRGRVEQVAVALRADPGPTIVDLRSRAKADKPLVGYELFARNSDEETTTPIGESDSNGQLTVPPGRTRLQTIFIKNGGQLLARLPIVPGAVDFLKVPLPDDDARLAAEARLSALREDLVDLVVQRNILMARTRQRIEAKDLKQARELLHQLDQLPARAQFNQAIAREARILHSDDPQIQKRIDRLVEATQTALSQFLDDRVVNDLHNEIRAAERRTEPDQAKG